jgi:hypothetical protein
MQFSNTGNRQVTNVSILKLMAKKKSNRRITLLGSLTAVFFFISILFLTDIHEAKAGKRLSAHEVRALMQEGKIKPLLDLIKQHSFEGNLLDAELERRRHRLIYELEYLNDKGEVWEYKLDASTGEILRKEQEE